MWLLGVAIVLVVLLALELALRARGFQPSASMVRDLWCLHRQRVVGADRHIIALLGNSRMQSGLSQSALREELPSMEPVQLAEAGKGPAAALHDLASDDSFRGLVLCEVTVRYLQPDRLEDQALLVDGCRESWGMAKELELHMRLAFQLRLVFLEDELSARHLLRAWRKGRWPKPTDRVLEDRTRFEPAGLRRVAGFDRDGKMRYDERVRSTPAAFRRTVDRLASDVRRIHARGGQVVFVHFPFGAQPLAEEESFYPRDQYWSVLAANSGAATIHFTEMPDAGSLVLEDGVHLHPASAERFTRWLAQELQRRNLVAR